jgi:cytochrome c-type biogenesis protein CcmH/NrfG
MRMLGCGLTVAIVVVAATVVVLRRPEPIADGRAIDHIVLSRTLLARGDLDAATDEARDAVVSDPRNPEAQLCLADVIAARSNWREALERYREAARLDPDSFPAHRGAANALNALEDTPGAERELRECLRLSPDDAKTHMNLASNLAVQGRFTEAIAEMKRAHELGSRDGNWSYPTHEWIAEFERELAEQGDTSTRPTKR